MRVGANRVVTFDFTVMDENGNLIESSKDTGAMCYLHGDGRIAAGLERALEGRSIGDSFSVHLTPSQGFGERDDSLIQTFTQEELAGLGKIEIGMQIQASDENGKRTLTITEIEDDRVVLDGNHPLAGKTVIFDVTVVDVRNATEEELGFDPSRDVRCTDDCNACELNFSDTEQDHNCECGGDCGHY